MPATTVDRRPPRWLWIITIIAGLLMWSTTFYGDIGITTQHGLNVWNALRDGRLLEYYQYCQEVFADSPYIPKWGANYGMLMYLVFGLWNLPLWVLQETTHLNVFGSVPAMLYAKAITLPFLAWSVVLVRRLGRELGLSDGRAAWAGYIFLTSGWIATAVGLAGQYDVIYVPFVLLGTLACIRGQRWAFVAFFAVAVAMKAFPLLLFLPLLLSREKNVLRILASLVGVYLPGALLTKPFQRNMVGDSGGRQLIDYMLTTNHVPLAAYQVSIPVAAYAAVLAAAYLIPQRRLAGWQTIWLVLAAVASFFVLAPSFVYWLALLAPWIALLIARLRRGFAQALLLDSGFAIPSTLAHIKTNTGIYDALPVATAWPRRFLGAWEQLPHQLSTHQLITKVLGQSVYVIADSAGFAMFLLLLAWLQPAWKRRPYLGGWRWVIALRLATFLGIMAISVVAYALLRAGAHI